MFFVCDLQKSKSYCCGAMWQQVLIYESVLYLLLYSSVQIIFSVMCMFVYI